MGEGGGGGEREGEEGGDGGEEESGEHGREWRLGDGRWGFLDGQTKKKEVGKWWNVLGVKHSKYFDKVTGHPSIFVS